MIKLYVSIWWAKAAHSDNYNEVVFFFTFLLLLASSYHPSIPDKLLTNSQKRLNICGDSFFFQKKINFTFFHWMLLHNTNQTQQHSCGYGRAQRILLQPGGASKAHSPSPAKLSIDTVVVCRCPVAKASPSLQRESTNICFRAAVHKTARRNSSFKTCSWTPPP